MRTSDPPSPALALGCVPMVGAALYQFFADVTFLNATDFTKFGRALRKENPGALAEAIVPLVGDPVHVLGWARALEREPRDSTMRRFAAVTAGIYEELLTATPAAANTRIRRSSTT